MRHVDVDERRARLARRHRLAPGTEAADVADAARAVVCLHATDPATVHLSAWARVPGVTVDDVGRALYDDRTLVKHLAMRRTLFAVPVEALPDVQAGASTRVAERERRRLVKLVEQAELVEDGGRWLARAEAAVLDELSNGRPATSSELRDRIPLLEGSLTIGEGRSWGGATAVGPRVLTVLSASGSIVRSTNAGRWTASRPRWSATTAWLGAPIPEVGAEEALAGLVSRWLRAFGPGTEDDIVWWLGATRTAVRAALRAVHAVEVDLDGPSVGHLLPDDVEPEDAVEPWAALLPALDPTTMGWTGRDWYLGPHRDLLFDTNGNAGPTAWWDGRIVGGWRQRDSGEVELQVLEDVGRDAMRALRRRAEELSAWFDGERVLPRFPSPLWRAT